MIYEKVFAHLPDHLRLTCPVTGKPRVQSKLGFLEVKSGALL